MEILRSPKKALDMHGELFMAKDCLRSLNDPKEPKTFRVLKRGPDLKLCY